MINAFPRHALAITLALLTCKAHALQPLITDDTGTQGRGGRQIEAAYTFDRIKSGGDYERAQSLPLTFTWGASDALDLFLTATPTRIHAETSDVRGMANTVIGAKWRFHEDEAKKLSLAIKPQVLLPVSAGRESAGLGTGKASFDLTFILTRELPDGALHFNLGAAEARHRDPAASSNTRHQRFSLAPVWNMTDHCKLVADAGLEWLKENSGGNRTREKFFELGTLYSPAKNLDFALGLIRRSDNQSPQAVTRSATVGLTWRY
jgi:hypothetical protein